MKQTKQKIMMVLVLLTIVFSLSISTKALTGKDNNNINITSGQISTLSINTVTTSLNIKGAIQTLSSIGNNSFLTLTRFGTLQNHAAPVSTLKTPENGSYKNQTIIEFKWENRDNDNDTLTSLIEIFNDSDLTKIYYRNSTIVSETYNVSINLSIPEELTFYWKTKANDSQFNSSFSELRKVTIDRTLPTPFNLTSPANNTASTDTSPELTWEKSTEANLSNYTVEFCTEITCANSTTLGTSTSLSFSEWSIGDVLEIGTHYWQVAATDKANNQRISNLFTYIVEASETATQVVSTGGGGGERTGGSGTQLFSLSIISPPDITLHANDSITIPLVIKNPARLVTLKDIGLSLSTDSEDITATLGKIKISQLKPGEQETIPLTIITKDSGPTTYGMTVIATVSKPEFVDRVRILANLIELGTAAKRQISQQLGFAKDLLDGNPECLDLNEYLVQAETAILEGKQAQADNLVESAIESCQKLIGRKNSLTAIQGSIIEVPYIIRENKTAVILSIETLGFLLFLYIVLRVVRKHKEKF